MKRFIVTLLLCGSLLGLTGCGNGYARYCGGEMTIELEPGQKLVEATWKDDELWYLTRPMEKGETPVTSTLSEKSEFGIVEGTVYFVESTEEK